MNKKEKKLNKKEKKEAKKAAKAEAAAKAEVEGGEKPSNALFKASVIRCVAAVLCTVFACVAVSKGASTVAETIKEMPVSQSVAVNGGSAVTDDTNAPAAADPSDVAPSDDTGSTDETPADTDSTDSTDASTGNKGTSGNSATQAPAGNKTPASASEMTKAQIITLFNNSVNSAKSSSKSIKQTQCKNSQTSDAVISHKTLQGIANKLISANMGDDKKKTNVVYSTAADKNANFPVSGQAWASKLTAADVKNATITEKNGVYNVKIALVDDTTPNIKKGQGHAGKAFSIVTKDQIVEGAGSLGMSVIEESSIKLTYKNCVINAVIDAKTGKLKNIHYFQDWTLSLTALKIDVSVSFGIDENFIINW